MQKSARKFSAISMVLLLGSCSRDDARDYDKALNSCRHVIPEIVSFHSLYPDAQDSISDYNVKKGVLRVWQCHMFLYDRYCVVMEIPDLRFDANDTTAIGWGTARYGLEEYVSINKERGSAVLDSHLFGPDEWKKLKASGGDFSVLGFSLKKHSPVDGISAFKSGHLP